MHETHLISPIIKDILEHARREGVKLVSKVTLKVGMLTAVTEDSFRETFSVLARGTALENAQLEIIFFPGQRVEIVSFDVE